MPEIVRSQEEIDDVLNKVSDQLDEGGSKFPGMSYEDGLRSMQAWLVGDSDDHPMDD